MKRFFAITQEESAITEIIRRLDHEGVLTLNLFAKQNGLIGKYQDADGCWNTKTVK